MMREKLRYWDRRVRVMFRLSCISKVLKKNLNLPSGYILGEKKA